MERKKERARECGNGEQVKGIPRMKIDEGTQLLAFASGKPLFPIGEGGGETVAHDLLSGLHNRGYQVKAFGIIQSIQR
jgi:hypothetical protein